MKKSLFFAGLAAALSLVGCNKETDVKGLDGRHVEIVLSDVATRTVNDGMSTAWAEGDALSVFYAPAGTTDWSANTKFTVTDAASNKATGEVELTAGSYDWYLFYPYTSQIPNPTGKSDEGEWTGYFYVGSSASGSQTQAGLNSSAHIAGNRVPVVGRATAVPADQTPAVSMKHLSTLLKINVTNVYEKPVTITKVSFTAPVNIVGSAYMDFSGAEPVLVPSEGHIGKTAQLTVSNAEPLATGSTASFYLAVMPFSIASGDLLTVDIVAEEGTFKAELEVGKAYTFEAGKVKNLNVDFEMETPIEAMTVTEALAAEDGSSVTIAGAVVAALSTKGFIITDGTSNVYVYLNAAPEVAIGDEVTLSATLDADYYGLPEIKSVASCKVTSSGNTVPYTTLVELDKDNIDGYDCTVAADYIAVTGTLEKSGNYYNVRPEGSARYARTDYLVSSIDPSSYVGKTVTMKGYFNTLHSTNNYLKVVVTEFISDDTPAAALASIAVSGQKTEFTLGETFSFGGTVTATYADDSTKDVTASATFSGYDMSTAGNQTVTVSYTEGDVTKTAKYDITVNAAATHAGTADDPLTASEARNLALSGDTGSYYISGIVTKVQNQYDANYGTANFWIDENGESQAVFEGYKIKYFDNKDWVKGNAEIAIDDEVIIYGTLTVFTSSSTTTPETSSGYLVSLNGKTKGLTPGTLTATPDSGNKQITVTWGEATGTDSAINYVVSCGEQSYNSTAAGSHTFTMTDYGIYKVSVLASASDAVSAELNANITLSDPTATEKTYTIQWGGEYNSAKISGYTASWSVTCGGFTCNMANWNNNNNAWNYVKAGRKNNASVATIITGSAIPEAIKTVILTIDAITASNVNSVKLYTSTDGDSWSEAGTFTKATGDQSIVISSPTANQYYKVEADCASGSSNGLIQVSKLVFTTN